MKDAKPIRLKPRSIGASTLAAVVALNSIGALGCSPHGSSGNSADFGKSAACAKMVRKNRLRRLGIGGDKR
jgi:hypothetical protein